MTLLRMPVVALCAGLALASTRVDAAVTTTVVDIPLPRGATQRILYVHPDAPVANLVVIPGGQGYYGIADDGMFEGGCDPYGRTLASFTARGIAVALVDQTSDFVHYQYEDIREAARYMRARDNVPIWVTGGSAGTRSAINFAGSYPPEGPLGLIVWSPTGFDPAKAALVRQPALVIFHTGDAGAKGEALRAALTAATPKELVALYGGSDAGCGYHLFNGLDAEFVAAIEGFIDRNNALTGPAASPNFQGLWWNAPAGSENGWGINFAHQGNVIFGTWFTYDTTGKGWWLTLITDSNPSPGVYTANLFVTTGPPFNATPFVKTSAATKVGIATLNFSDASNGTFHYEVTLPGGTVSQTKAITQQQLAAPPLASCASATTPLTAATNYQDIWWAGTSASPGTEQGWGINFTHQGDLIFASWFTYDLDGTPLWVVATAPKIAPGVYKGDLYRPSGPRFDAYDKSQWKPNAPVGSLTLTFADGNNATMDYTVQLATMTTPVPQTKSITRQLFTPQGTICH